MAKKKKTVRARARATVKRVGTRAKKTMRTAKRSVAARRGAATRRMHHRRTRPQPDLMTRATRTIRKVADTAMGVTKSAIDAVRP